MFPYKFTPVENKLKNKVSSPFTNSNEPLKSTYSHPNFQIPIFAMNKNDEEDIKKKESLKLSYINNYLPSLDISDYAKKGIAMQNKQG